MSFMLASVASLDEARLVDRLGVDIIDLKQPAEGALGALEVGTVADIVAELKPAATISATVGDLPMEAELLAAAAQAMAATGVDYVKIGFFPGGDWQGCITALSKLADQGHHLIAVLFADTRPDLTIIETLAEAGFRGVMLDTMDKHHGSLVELMTIEELQGFVQRAKTCSLLTGLAGSLRVSDIVHLMPLHADYLGFRGALCRQRNRIAELDKTQVVEIRSLLADTRFKVQGKKLHES